MVCHPLRHCASSSASKTHQSNWSTVHRRSAMAQFIPLNLWDGFPSCHDKYQIADLALFLTLVASLKHSRATAFEVPRRHDRRGVVIQVPNRCAPMYRWPCLLCAHCLIFDPTGPSDAHKLQQFPIAAKGESCSSRLQRAEAYDQCWSVISGRLEVLLFDELHAHSKRVLRRGAPLLACCYGVPGQGVGAFTEVPAKQRYTAEAYDQCWSVISGRLKVLALQERNEHCCRVPSRGAPPACVDRVLPCYPWAEHGCLYHTACRVYQTAVTNATIKSKAKRRGCTCFRIQPLFFVVFQQCIDEYLSLLGGIKQTRSVS